MIHTVKSCMIWRDSTFRPFPVYAFTTVNYTRNVNNTIVLDTALGDDKINATKP